MMLDLKKLLDGSLPSIPFELQYDISAISEDIISGKANVGGLVVNHSGSVTLTGSISAECICVCARCGEEFPETLFIPIDAKLAESLENDDEEEFVLLNDAKLDIGEFIRSTLILELPSRYLCSSECKGLCPVCGCNLNKQKCSCTEKNNDPRWQALNTFFEE